MIFKHHIRICSLVIILICILLVSCGLSPEEQAATAAALTAAAATDTPTPTSTPTPSPTPTLIPYDLSVTVMGEEDVPIIGATVMLAEAMEKDSTQITDDAGQVMWYDLPGEAVNLSISAQGYFQTEVSDTIERGENQLKVTLERDPFGLLPSEACMPGERLLYIEDFQDGEAQHWRTIEQRALGRNIVTDPDMPGDMVLFIPADIDGGGRLRNHIFENGVWRVKFMPVRRPIFNFSWHWNPGGYEVEETTVESSSYAIWFHPPGLRVFRGQTPVSTIILGEIERTMKSGEWHQLEIGTFGSVLEIWIDGRRFLAYDDQNPLPDGYISFYVGYGKPLDPQSVIYYDDFVVCELTAPFVPMPTPEP